MPGSRGGGWGFGLKSSGRPIRILILVAALSLILVAGKGHGMQCLITVNTSSTDQWHPDVSGDTIAWEDASDRSIHLYNLSTGIESRVAISTVTQSYPAISGSLVAWQEGTGISARNLSIGPAWEVTPDGQSPAVDGGRIAWVDRTTGELTLSPEGAPGSLVLTSNGDTTNTHPSLSGDWIVWANATWPNIYRLAISTGEESAVATDSFGANRNPSVSGNRIVWQDDRNIVYDIYLSNLSLGDETPLTSAASDQESPAIDGTRVAWVDTASSGIYLGLDMADTGSPREVIGTGGVNDLPRISSDRVVWQKYSGGHYDIYLYTINSPQPCPAAGFSANITSGAAPLTVQFTDTSGDPGITRRSWEFGDGTTSSEESPVHTYTADGSYPVALTVGSAVGRDYHTEPAYIRVSLIPIASFTANQTTGIAPFPVRFTDTSSGNPSNRSWNFGDGETSNETNPVHEYDAPGTYTVSLAATNANGTGAKTLPGLIQVLNGKNLRATTDIGGLQVSSAGGRQEITLDTTMMAGSTYDPAAPASFSFIPQNQSGWQRMTFFSSDGIGFAMDGSGVIRGNLSSCTLESLEIVPSTFASGVGNNLPVTYRLDLSGYPSHAIVNATVWEDTTPADDPVFRHALMTAPGSQFTSLIDYAYTLHFVTVNLSGVTGTTLTLPVATSWVQQGGGGNNVTVLRLGDDGTQEILNPAAMNTHQGEGLEYFTIPSPHGLSRFALVSATGSSNLFQMGARVATQMIQSTGRSSNDLPSAGGTAGWGQPAPPAKAPEPPAATYYGDGKLDTTPAGILRAPVVIAAEDRGASLLISAGAKALDGAGNPLTLITARAATAGSVPPAPEGEGALLAGMAYDIGPDGATFEPPATVSFTVPGNLWDPGTGYSIRSYSAQAGSWEEIPSSVDPSSQAVTGRVSHLCLFGLFAVTPAAAPATFAPVQEPARAAPVVQPAPVARTPMGIFTGLMGWMFTTAMANLAVTATALLVALAALALFTRRAWLSRHRTWITLYLASLTGLLWAAFLLASGGPPWEAFFILITVAGLNLIVHLFRFDRIEVSLRAPDPLRA
jgi:beta propeller repeat protein